MYLCRLWEMELIACASKVQPVTSVQHAANLECVSVRGHDREVLFVCLKPGSERFSTSFNTMSLHRTLVSFIEWLKKQNKRNQSKILASAWINWHHQSVHTEVATNEWNRKQKELSEQKCQVSWACGSAFVRMRVSGSKLRETTVSDYLYLRKYQCWFNDMINGPWCVCKLWSEVWLSTQTGRKLGVTSRSRFLFTQLWKGIFNDLSLSFFSEEIISKPSLLYWLGLEGFPWCRFHFLPPPL